MDPNNAKIFTFRFVNAADIIAIGSVLPIICIIIVALRFFTRTRQVAHVGTDDWLILAGAVILFAIQNLRTESDNSFPDMYNRDGRLPSGW